jgi:Putative zinc-finger
MDHQTALRFQAAEKYVSGELPEAERDAFEEHFFECAECAEEVRWEQVFAANTRAALREQPGRPPVTAAAAFGKAAGWFSLEWLRPAFTVSALANLLLLGVVGYQALHVVPGLQSALDQAETPQLTTPVAVPTPVRSEPKLIQVPASVHVLPLSFAAPRQFPEYLYEITPEGGGRSFSGAFPSPVVAGEELYFSLPTARLEPGIYRVVLKGLDGSDRVELGRCRLQIEH